MAVSPAAYQRANQNWTTEVSPARTASAPSGNWIVHPAPGEAAGSLYSDSGGYIDTSASQAAQSVQTAQTAHSAQTAQTAHNVPTAQSAQSAGAGNAGAGIAGNGNTGTGNTGTGTAGGGNGNYMDIIGRDIENNLPPGEIGAPDSLEEVFRGSMKALLLRNIGNYVVATFLIGTQGTVSWEGILYDVGNDYLAIYQTGRDQYIVSDLYSLKYVEFYDTRRREMCDALLAQQNME